MTAGKNLIAPVIMKDTGTQKIVLGLGIMKRTNTKIMTKTNRTVTRMTDDQRIEDTNSIDQAGGDVE